MSIFANSKIVETSLLSSHPTTTASRPFYSMSITHGPPNNNRLRPNTHLSKPLHYLNPSCQAGGPLRSKPDVWAQVTSGTGPAFSLDQHNRPLLHFDTLNTGYLLFCCAIVRVLGQPHVGFRQERSARVTLGEQIRRS